MTQPAPETPAQRARRILLSGRNRITVIRIGLVLGLVLALSSFTPMAVMPAVIAELLTFAAILAGVIAALTRQPIAAARLTPWDEATVFLLLAQVARLLTDQEAVNRAVGS